MSRLTDLLTRLRDKDSSLAADLEREISALTERRAFGLNFERHVPEAVELPGRKVRKGDKVRVLPPRGETGSGDKSLWRVISIAAGTASLEALGADEEGSTICETQVADLVVVAEFRDPIYPGLVSTGKVERGGDKPFHTVINAENYHALQTLLFTHRGRVDCIYIDPPYNTGAKDWKYNNDYVDGEDLYRHSKWLAMMERRLLLAQELLNPENSVIIVTIDEREYLRLGLLLQQIFPSERIQMVSTSINPKGVARGSEFYRVDEYIFFIFVGDARVAPLFATGLCVGEDFEAGEVAPKPVRWGALLRSGSNARRADRPSLHYPIFVHTESHKIVGVGPPLAPSSERHEWEGQVPSGCAPIWPIRIDGSDGRWQLAGASLMQLVDLGYAKATSIDAEGQRGVVMYLPTGLIEDINSGEVEIVSRNENGVVKLSYSTQVVRSARPRTQWNSKSHSASEYGTTLLRSLLPGRSFPFPKSLYAVEDALRFFVADKPESVILDFFSGSGTTAHAVMRLNRQDGGHRQVVLVTNNEVSADEQKALRQGGLRPGDAEWEKWGICDFITKPRIASAVSGVTPEGEPVKGDYKFTDEFPIAQGFEENVEFFTLTYEAPLRVASHLEFTKIAPILWMRAGSRGRRIEDLSRGWDVADVYGVLADLDQTEQFLKAVVIAGDDLAVAFIVTDEDRLFESIARNLPDHVEPVRLYESYLRNFEIESGRGTP